MCDLLRKKLVLAGMSPSKEKSISTLDSSVRMHMTLMKSTYASRDKPKAFDAKVILDEYKDYHFGIFKIEKVSVPLNTFSFCCNLAFMNEESSDSLLVGC
ncbi:unnamed protein product [Strongylus vulgaris]|uniref:A-kinase anchor protein 7-like phosphoesterase domain-containing protein n=1 Tax=Strongylus vulgaris TaxID=40348 RepID=A0A3P7ITN9_STRVU|nr:unnamed protein product [Strongylus vulgaris]